ncbi:bifunctional phosphopantothenoylcysteine decarboxylase/phosphopantothenate--cysteine ligase CoaBC [Brachyspira sp.]|uniref:bifunctional phosphopantothenoylcysteine decarboxylase/phosphopantothenate--cysteine ligase CoaBC n=1 Tax=Brachyspira sp. TaxID=1977261 RepID=UPI003D7DBD8B
MRILIAITSSISAYKIPVLVSMLKKEGHEIICAVTKNAENMVGVKALETMSGNHVIRNIWKEEDPLIHININKKTDALLIAPIDANMIGKIANGIYDDSISTIACAYTGRKLFAPAMNPYMWLNKTVQKNVKYMIEELNYEIIEPERGAMACEEDGIGRLASFETIINKLTNNKYGDIRFTITAGATKEWIDPIRYITNSSSGKMGEALYNEINSKNGSIIYIEGSVLSPLTINSNNSKNKKIKVDTTEELKETVLSELKNTDILFMAAAPLDFKPAKIFDKKIKKQNINNIELIQNEDILALTKDKKLKNCLIVSFAAETAETAEELKKYAIDKMERKNADMIVANNIKDAIGKDTNKITIFFKDGRVKDFPILSKKECAKEIVNIAVEEWHNKNK